MHTPVLLKEILDYLADKELALFVDGTLGFGGHTEAILQHHPEIQEIIALDQDRYALEQASARLASFAGKIRFVHDNFRNIQYVLSGQKADAILLDIGVSSMQLDQAERGFSFQKEGPLDMRMDQEQSLDAKEIINRFPEKELARILFEYGEVRGSRRLASALVEARKKRRFETTKELSNFLTPLMGYHPKKIHPMTLVFQGLRIAVNDELGALQKALEGAYASLSSGGRLFVISFHSLEDRIVKNFFRDQAREGGTLLTKKPLIASNEELRQNPRSRSAKLRIIQK